MAKYPNITLTNAGLSMVAESQGSGQLIFTNIKLGAGSLAAGEDIKVLAAVKNPLLTANISNIDTKTAGQTTLTAVISNAAVTSGFFAKEMGVYAKIGTGGTEKLYAYTNAGNYADYMPDKTAQINENQIKITLIVGNAANVTAIIDGSIVYPTKETMTESITKAVKAHDEKADSHAPAFAAHNADQNAHGIFLKKSGGTMTGLLTASAGVAGTKIIASDWFISKENTGWRSEKYGGGWHMADTDWVRTLNGKGIYTSGKIQADDGFYGRMYGALSGNATTSDVAKTVEGTYNGNGGRVAPDFFGRNRAGFIMSNDIPATNTFKNWLIMDNYNDSDVGGVTAIGLDRQLTKAYIMRSGSDRQSWVENAELITSANISAQSVAHASTADQLNGYTAVQLLAAAKKTSASLGGNGWWKDGNTGMMVQWGNAGVLSNSGTTVLFPTAFPAVCARVFLIATGTISLNEYGAYIYSKAAASFVGCVRTLDGKDTAANFEYIAIGY